METQRVSPDQEMLQEMVRLQKLTTGQYNGWASGMDSQGLLTEFVGLLREEHQIRFDLCREAEKRGWFQVEQVSNQELQAVQARWLCQKQQSGRFC